MVEQAAGQKLSNPKQSMFARFGKGIALVLVMSVFTMPLSASALWSDSRELSDASLNAATVAPPTSFSCADVQTGLLGLVNEAELAWKGSPQTTSYVLEFLNPEGSTLGSATNLAVICRADSRVPQGHGRIDLYGLDRQHAA